MGDFPAAMDAEVMASDDVRQNQMMQYFKSKKLQAGLQKLMFDLLLEPGD